MVYCRGMIIPKAPDFKGRYPSAGERIGPAWQIIWEALGDGRELTITEMSDLPGVEVVRATISSLMYEARKAGVVTSRTVNHPRTKGLRLSYFRRADVETVRY